MYIFIKRFVILKKKIMINNILVLSLIIRYGENYWIYFEDMFMKIWLKLVLYCLVFSIECSLCELSLSLIVLWKYFFKIK